MRGRRDARRHQSPEVDDPAHAGGSGLAREVLRGRGLAGGERCLAVLRMFHRVDQEVGDVDPVEGLREARPGDGVAGHHRDVEPRITPTAAQAAHRVSVPA